MSAPALDQPAPLPPLSTRLVEVAALMLRLGFTAFGGPAAHLAMMTDEVVKRRRWLTEQEFLDLLGASGLIPGPTSTEMAIHIGRHRAGVAGLWVAGACFITPAVLITLVIAWAYARLGTLPAAERLLFGVKPAVIAIVLGALVKLARTAVKRAELGVLAAAGVAAYLLGTSEIVVLIGSGLLGIVTVYPWNRGGLSANVTPLLLAAAPWISGANPATAADTPPATNAGPPASAIFLYFFKIGSLLFGGGYVLVAFVRQQLVGHLHWISEKELLDAVAVGQFTPGPVFSTATFIGYLVGHRGPAGGLLGAGAASLGIFLPSFLFVWATHPLVRRLRSAPWSAGFLDGLNAGTIALMTGVLLQLTRAAVQPHRSAWVLLAVAAAVVLGTRVNSVWVILGGAAAGWLLLW